MRGSADTSSGSVVATSDYSYETGSTRLAELKHTAAQTRAYTFTDDPGDRITQILSYDGSNNYTHNKRNELLTASLDSESYDYDGAGNRTGYTIDPNNEVEFDGTNTYTYDKEGNRKTKVDSSGTTTYTWDHNNRLTQVQTTTVTVDYKYDLFDRRIERAVAGGATQRWGYDGDSIVLETDGSNAVTHRYLQGPVIDQIFADEKIGAGNYWPLTDHLGTVRDLVNNSGTNLNHIQYNSFGKRLTAEDPEGEETLYSFTGRERDAETGLYYYRARYYDPAVGTFISVDPSGFNAGDSNLYRYVKNTPTLHTDPSGMVWQITRNGEATAMAIPEFGDTIQELADIIGLDAKEKDAWLRYAAHEKDAPPIEKVTINAPLKAGTKFSIPNTIVGIYAFNAWRDTGQRLTGGIVASFDSSMEYLKKVGFKVIVEDVKTGWSDTTPTPKEILQDIKGPSEKAELHGLWYQGHGVEEGMRLRKANWTPFIGCDRVVLKWSDVSDVLKYRLALVVANACDSKKGSKRLVTGTKSHVHDAFEGFGSTFGFVSAEKIYSTGRQGTAPPK